MAALPLLMLAATAHGQVPGSVEDYHLPPASPSPAPTVAGPVDTDHPVAAPTRPAAVPSPVIVLPAPTATRAAPRAAATAAPRPERQVEQPAAKLPPSPAVAPPFAAPSAPAAIAPATPAPPPIPAAAPPSATATTPRQDGFPWLWLAGAAIVLGLAGLLLWRRRPARNEPIVYEEPDRPPAPEPEPVPAAAPEAAPRPPLPDPLPPPQAPEPVAAAPAASPEAFRPLELQLEARHLSRALVNATLAYRLTLTNHGEAELGPLRVAGDITSAHASLSAQDQLAPAGEALATLHQVDGLAPGASVALNGELRMPLASILPIHSGGARVFVPLARLRVETDHGTAASGVFVIGQASDPPGGALRPFPLDRGPGIDRGLDQRQLALPA